MNDMRKIKLPRNSAHAFGNDAADPVPCTDLANSGGPVAERPRERSVEANSVSKSKPFSEATRKRSGGRRVPLTGRVRTYLDGLRKTHTLLPRHPRREEPTPYCLEIAEEVGCDGLALQRNVECLELLAEHGRKYGFRDATVKPRRRCEPVQARLNDWAAQLRANGQQVPASLSYPDRPDYAKIERDIDSDGGALVDPKKPFRQFILDVAKEIGLEPIDVSNATAEVTVKETTAEAIRVTRTRMNREAKTDKQIGAAIANLRWAAKKVVEHAGSAAAPALAAIEAAIEHYGEDDRKLRSELVQLRETALACAQLGLSQDFSSSLRQMFDRTGLPVATVAREIGMPEQVLREWVNGERAPAQPTRPAVADLERYFKLPGGTLAQRIAVNRRRGRPMDDEDSGSGSGLDTAPYALRPDWPKDASPGKDAYPGVVSDWPIRLGAERDAFFNFRTDPHAPAKKMRDPALKPWSPSTMEIRDTALGRLFGFWASASERFCIARENLTFALLVKPEFVDEYRQFVASRRAEKVGRRRATAFDKAFLQLLRLFFDPKFGWLTQSPELAERLVPIEAGDGSASILSASEIDEIRRDWTGACAKAFKTYDNWVRATKKDVDIERRHAPVRAILHLVDPSDAFKLGWRVLQQEMQTLDRSKVSYHLSVRDAVMWGIQSQRAFRRKHSELFTYRPNNLGNLRKASDAWRLWASAKDFKNKHGTYFRDNKKVLDYDVQLLDIQGFYAVLDEYIKVSRLFLLKGRASDKLFIAENGSDLETPGATQAMMRVYNRYVRWDENAKTGIEGAGRVSGVQWMRYVLATAVLKATLNFQLAADAIHDSVRTVEEHYARYLPSDRARPLEAALLKMWNTPVTTS